ncbi:MAG: hypothetical protein AcusKO_29460 [Acuticoccus sp.]
MKRDMRLIEDLLAAIEKKDNAQYSAIRVPGYPTVLINEHLRILLETRCIEGAAEVEGKGIFVTRMTMEGHELLYVLREGGIWNQIKSSVSAETLAAIPLDVIRKVGLKLVERSLLRQLGL